MKKQTKSQQQETHGKTTKHTNNKDKGTRNTKDNTILLRLKAGYNQHASLFSEPTY
jgi:hypothetical protein